MTRALVPTPMPVVLSMAEAEERFGAGSELAVLVRGRLEAPRPRVCGGCSGPLAIVDGNRCAPCRAREDLLLDVEKAFWMVGRCVALVEAHAQALYDADTEARFSCAMAAFRYWRGVAFASLALVFARSPELLPFRETDDGGEW